MIVINELIKGELIVSCQALENEPLHSSFIMSKMAKAAEEGGAKGIRANSVADIECIKKEVKLPIIGIIKRNYPNCEAFITPTMKEIDELMEVKPDVIAVDATSSSRPNEENLETFFKKIKQKYPDQLLMADCSTLDEMIFADKLGFDFIGTTLVGYTRQSNGKKIEENNFELIQQAIKKVNTPVIAEGNIDTPEKVRKVIDIGVYTVVVGSIITRPQIITQRFVSALRK